MFLSLEEAELDSGLGGEQRFGLRCRLDHAAEKLGDPREVLFEHVQHRRRVEGGRRMVERVEQDGAAAEFDLLLLAVDTRDPGRLAREQLRREVAERSDELRLDQLYLAEEVPFSCLDLVRHRIAVPGRPALDHVRDVHVVAGHADPTQELVQELPRLADERVALLVFVEARRLADEHQLGLRVANAEDDLGAALGETAARAAGDLGRVGV